MWIQKVKEVLYTVAEHKWDEAFGYFGARRDFLNPAVWVIV